VLASKGYHHLNAKGWIGDKPCLVTTDTRAPVTIPRRYITAGLLTRALTGPYILYMASGETLPILKETLVQLALGKGSLTTQVFIAKITDEFI
jgi:hypothetical protein